MLWLLAVLLAVSALLLYLWRPRRWPFKKLRRRGSCRSGGLPCGSAALEERQRDFVRTQPQLRLVTPKGLEPWQAKGGDLDKAHLEATFKELQAPGRQSLRWWKRGAEGVNLIEDVGKSQLWATKSTRFSTISGHGHRPKDWLELELAALKCPVRHQLAERVCGLVAATEGFRFAMEHEVGVGLRHEHPMKHGRNTMKNG